MSEELLLEIRVTLLEPFSVKGACDRVVMIPFTGEAKGKLFSGKTLGWGVDTQHIRPDGKAVLSARYMLEGTDADGSNCRIFIENSGSFEQGFRPQLVTDSPILAAWEKARTRAEVSPVPGGVTVRIFGKVNG